MLLYVSFAGMVGPEYPCRWSIPTAIEKKHAWIIKVKSTFVISIPLKVSVKEEIQQIKFNTKNTYHLLLYIVFFFFRTLIFKIPDIKASSNSKCRNHDAKCNTTPHTFWVKILDCWALRHIA